MASSDPNFVYSLAKGLDILSAFAEGEMLGNQQLAQRTGLPKATVSRLTSTLLALGYLRMDARTRKLLMGSRLMGMAAGVQRRIGVQHIAQPMLARMSAETGLSVLVGTRDRLGMMVLEVIRPPEENLTVITVEAGTVLPLTDTALGLAYLVRAPVQEKTSLLEKLAQRFPEQWPALRQRIALAHTQYQRSGFVTTRRSWQRNVNGVAIAFAPGMHQTLYSFSLAGTPARMSTARMQTRLGPMLCQFVQQLQRAMAHTASPWFHPPEIYAP